MVDCQPVEFVGSPLGIVIEVCRQRPRHIEADSARPRVLGLHGDEHGSQILILLV